MDFSYKLHTEGKEPYLDIVAVRNALRYAEVTLEDFKARASIGEYLFRTDREISRETSNKILDRLREENIKFILKKDV